MKRVFPHQLVFITAIVLDRVAISSTQIGIAQCLRALTVLLLAAAIASLTIQRFAKDWHYTHFIVLVLLVALVVYRSLYRALKTSFPYQADQTGFALLGIMAVLVVGILHRKVWKSIRKPARLTAYFNLVFTMLLSFQLVRLGPSGYHMVAQLSHPRLNAAFTMGPEFKLSQAASSPDIYVIILDGYARQDVLQAIYEYDNSQFIGELGKRGFYVAEGSHSNYAQTPYTMASLWNLDYLPTWNWADQYQQYLFDPIQHNRVFHSLDEAGYTTVSLNGAAHFMEIANSDVYLSNVLHLNDFESLLLVDSPIEPLADTFDLGIPVQTYKAHHQRTLYQLDQLKDIPVTVPGPKIVYAHLLTPHPPFVFYENGALRVQPRPYTMAEGIQSQGGRQAYWEGYREQIEFINREIIKVIDAILQKSKSPPIIVLMGDHGPASMFSFDMKAPGCLWERTSNLYAMFLPGHTNDDVLYPSISPVNTFRLIFNTYFGTHLPLLEDRSYLMYWYQPSLKVDITDSRDTRNSCSLPSD